MAHTGRPRHDRNRVCPKCGTAFVAKDLRTVHCSRSCAVRKYVTPRTKTCAACGQPFTALPSIGPAQWERQRHCSRKCAATTRTKLMLTCDACGIVYHGKDKGLAHTFCSTSCYGAWASANASLDPCANGAFSKGAKAVLMATAGGRCQRCGAIDDLEFDHVIPQAAGGLGVVANGQVLCGTCHWTKTLGERMLIRDLLRAHFHMGT